MLYSGDYIIHMYSTWRNHTTVWIQWLECKISWYWPLNKNFFFSKEKQAHSPLGPAFNNFTIFSSEKVEQKKLHPFFLIKGAATPHVCSTRQLPRYWGRGGMWAGQYKVGHPPPPGHGQSGKQTGKSTKNNPTTVANWRVMYIVQE